MLYINYIYYNTQYTLTISLIFFFLYIYKIVIVIVIFPKKRKKKIKKMFMNCRKISNLFILYYSKLKKL